MVANPDLIERSGDLKRELLDFAETSRFRREMKRAFEQRFGKVGARDEGELGNFLDYFALQHRHEDGRTVVDHFVAKHRELPDAERQMLLGWRDVVEGIFTVQRRDGDALIVANLVDELTYRVRSNMGPAVFAQMPAGSFINARLVPIGDEWLISGYSRLISASRRADAYRAAAKLAMQHPSLVYRNPDKLARAWERQREDRRRFIEYFGSDLVVVPGRELAERMRAYTQFLTYEVRDAEGKSAADRAKQTYGFSPEALDWGLPDELLEAETVGILHDEVDGLNFYANIGLIQETFATPELAADRYHREAVRRYLEEPTISPRLFHRLAEPDPDRASRVFQQVLKQARFSWERDGEELLRRYKARYFEQPVLPGVIMLSEQLTRAQMTTSSADAGLPSVRRPGRNDPCPCGSGKKYKRCCGR